MSHISRRPPPKSIAILPFVDMSPNQKNEYLGDGFSEEIINALTKLEGLKVTARTSSFAFRNKNMDVREIGKELGVRILLEGSIRVIQEKIRISVQLIDVADGFHFWSETFNRSLNDVFALQDEISLIIADKLRENLGHFHLNDKLISISGLSTELYQQFLKGKHQIQKLNVVGVENGIETLLDVIKKAPRFPLSYLIIQQGYSFLGTIGVLPSEKAFSLSQSYLDKAIELDENLPECQYHLANIAFWQKWDFERTYMHLSKALELRPGYADAYCLVASTLASERKYEAANTYIKTAIQLDPFSAANHYWKGCILYFQEKFEEAISCFKKSLSLDAHFIFSEIIWGASLLLLGRHEEGLAKYQSLPPAGEADLSKLGGSTLAYAIMGAHQKTEHGLNQLKGLLKTDVMGRALIFMALVETIRGNYNQALSLIKQGIEHKLPVILMLNAEPFLKPLHQNHHFQQMMGEIFNPNQDSQFTKKKYARSSLNPEKAESRYRQLLQIMSVEKPYLNSELNLRMLAKIIDLHPNQLSQLLNERIGQNFSEFVNNYRLNSFKEKAENPEYQHLTILALALDCGFNSKTVFNTFFKKKMGKTPSEYWKEIIR